MLMSENRSSPPPLSAFLVDVVLDFSQVASNIKASLTSCNRLSFSLKGLKLSPSTVIVTTSVHHKAGVNQTCLTHTFSRLATASNFLTVVCTVEHQVLCLLFLRLRCGWPSAFRCLRRSILSNAFYRQWHPILYLGKRLRTRCGLPVRNLGVVSNALNSSIALQVHS